MILEIIYKSLRWCWFVWWFSAPELVVNTYPSRTIYYTFISVVLYFFPILVMTVAYSLIAWRLWSSHMPGERVESEVKAQNKIKKRVSLFISLNWSIQRLPIFLNFRWRLRETSTAPRARLDIFQMSVHWYCECHKCVSLERVISQKIVKSKSNFSRIDVVK